MADKPKSFFMFCFGADFTTKLSIPTAFVEDHGLDRLPRLSLRLKAKPEGRSWAVKIKKINGVFYMADGWSKFVNDNLIEEMKLLVFYISGDSTSLHVAIFGQDSCLELPTSSSRIYMQTDKPTRTWKLVRKFAKEYNMGKMKFRIPTDLAAETGIGKKKEMDMEDWNGRKWAITITERGKGGEGCFVFGAGWKPFVKANKLLPGAILVFEFADDEVKVVLMEGEAGENMLRRAKPGGFLPLASSLF